jgi:hypothetical protein
MEQDVALICMNGHMINDSSKKYPESNTKFCEKCGTENIDKCPTCGSLIRGYKHYEYDLSNESLDTPAYCHNCGKAYPWTEERLKALEETIDLMDELSTEEKSEFKKSMAEITTDNPRTSLAILKIKKFSAKVGKEIWGATKDIIVQIGTETVQKSLGLK